MLRKLRLGLIALSAIAFYAVWHINPEVLSPRHLYILASSWFATWALALYFYKKISELSTLKELGSKAYQRLTLALPEIRSRIWFATAISGISSLLILAIAALDLARESALYASATGLLLGFVLSYIILYPFWLNEVQNFIEKARLDNTFSEKRSVALKSFGSPRDKP